MKTHEQLLEWADLAGHLSDPEAFDPNWDEDEEDEEDDDDEAPDCFINIRFEGHNIVEYIYRRPDNTYYQLHVDRLNRIRMTTELETPDFVSWH